MRSVAPIRSFMNSVRAFSAYAAAAVFASATARAATSRSAAAVCGDVARPGRGVKFGMPVKPVLIAVLYSGPSRYSDKRSPKCAPLVSEHLERHLDGHIHFG